MIPTLNLLGCGKLGKTLGKLWQTRRRFKLHQLWSRNPETTRSCGAFIGAGNPVDTFDELLPADIWLIATPDSAIARLAQRLAERGIVRHGDIVFHCSGALTSDILTPVSSQGARLASIHPIHSFADPSASVERFAGSYCAAEGDADALAVLKPAFESIGAHLFDIDTGQKTLYHSATVIASNYLVALLEASLQSFEAAGIEPRLAARFLLPIVHQTADNTLVNGSVRALTGPIARGDYTTVKNQLERLRHTDALLCRLYQVMGEQALAIAYQQNNADPQQLDRIKYLLQDYRDV